MKTKAIVHSALGKVMHAFEVDASTGALTAVQSLAMPAVIQYAWPNRARTLLYVASSNGGPMCTPRRPEHFVQAFRIMPDGALVAHGEAVPLNNRPLHVSLDLAEAYLLLAYNDPEDVTVHRLQSDGTIGRQVAQPPMDFGVTVHQARVTPHGNIVLVPACGHHPTGELAGSLGVFSFREGQLTPLSRMEADPSRAQPWQGKRHGAQGFAARHVTFHPTRPWMYLCVERQGEIRLHDYDENSVAPQPRAIVSTLEGAQTGRSVQLASAIHVHPNGRFVYVSNRAYDTEKVGGQDVFVGGVNDIAVFEIEQETGVPRLIQHVDTQGIFPRTFGLDAAGKVLVAGNQDTRWAREDGALRKILPSLAVFAVGDDGRLSWLNRHEYADTGDVCFWTGVMSLGGE